MFTYFLSGNNNNRYVDGNLIYCQQDINHSSLRPARTVDGNLVYCQQDINQFTRP